MSMATMCRAGEPAAVAATRRRRRPCKCLFRDARPSLRRECCRGEESRARGRPRQSQKQSRAKMKFIVHGSLPSPHACQTCRLLVLWTTSGLGVSLYRPRQVVSMRPGCGVGRWGMGMPAHLLYEMSDAVIPCSRIASASSSSGHHTTCISMAVL